MTPPIRQGGSNECSRNTCHEEGGDKFSCIKRVPLKIIDVIEGDIGDQPELDPCSDGSDADEKRERYFLVSGERCFHLLLRLSMSKLHRSGKHFHIKDQNHTDYNSKQDHAQSALKAKGGKKCKAQDRSYGNAKVTAYCKN